MTISLLRMVMMLKLGSLFDGSGGFPLAGMLEGIKPVWSSEIEPFPIRVTTKRLPQVKHYGDVSRMDGSQLEPVDIITFGSPCQDLSLAGKRRGLDGSRSGLFYEAVRIIREMRRATDGRYPRWCIWENVPGAFSSNKGEDFRCVIETLCQVADESVYIPRPEKWDPAGAVMGDSYTLAWRQLDAQYWGVPQRRKRVFIVTNFAEGGGRAPEVLFDSGSLHGNSEEMQSQGQETASEIRESTDTAVSVYENHSQDCRYRELDGVSTTLASNLGTGGNNQPLVVDESTAYRICSQGSNAMNSANPLSGIYETSVAPTVDTSDQSPNKSQGGICIYTSNKASHFTATDKNIAQTLVATDYKEPQIVFPDCSQIVRRLTPTECARLQGFPDWWCSDLDTPESEITESDIAFWRGVFETHRAIVTNAEKGKTDKQIIKWLTNPHSDAAEYKMWGNGVALPCVRFIMRNIRLAEDNENV